MVQRTNRPRTDSDGGYRFPDPSPLIPRPWPVEILFLLIPLAAIIAVVMTVAFFWSVKSGQFDDLEGPAHRILMDEKRPDVQAPTGREKDGK